MLLNMSWFWLDQLISLEDHHLRKTWSLTLSQLMPFSYGVKRLLTFSYLWSSLSGRSWSSTLFIFFFHLFLFIGGQLLYNIVVASAIHRHESAMDLHVFPIPIPPPASLPIPSLWALPVHQPWAPISCIQPGLVICFTLDSILVSMLFSPNIPPSPSPTESKSLFCTSVSLFLFCIFLTIF